MHVLPVHILGAVLLRNFLPGPLLGKGAVPAGTSALYLSLKLLDDRAIFNLFAIVTFIGSLKLIRLQT